MGLPVAIITVEAKIISLLEAVVTDMPVEPFPDDPAAYHTGQYDSANGAILVSMRDGDKTTQDEKSSGFDYGVRLVVFTPGLRSAGQQQGAYNVVEKVIEALDGKGFILPAPLPSLNQERMKVSVERWRFRQYLNMTWEYHVDAVVRLAMRRRRNIAGSTP